MDFVQSLFNDLFDFVIERPDIILNAVIEHVYITIGIALGVLITRVRFLYDPILTVAGAIYTIPSIAMFVIMIRVGREIADQNVPILKDIFGIGFGSAVIALVLYLLLMIIRNTAVGIDSVDPVECLAKRWKTYLHASMQVEGVVYVKYEEFCEDKVGVISTLCEKLGLPFNEERVTQLCDIQLSHASVRAYRPSGRLLRLPTLWP